MGESLGEPLSWFRHKFGQEKNPLLTVNGKQAGCNELKLCLWVIWRNKWHWKKKILQARWLITAINNLPWPSIHLVTEAIIRGLCEEAVQNT